MSALSTAQDVLQDWLLHARPRAAAHLAGDRREERLRIYADAYRLRLCEVLGNDFPACRALLGAAAFDRLAAAYLRAHPSRRPSVRHFGAQFAPWLQRCNGLPRHLHQLAALEWAQGDCFDARDVPALDSARIAGLPAAAWPTLRLQLRPCVRVLVLESNAAAVLTAQAEGRPLPRLRRQRASHWLLWRQSGGVRWRRSNADESACLRALRDGARFADLCQCLHVFHPQDGALRAASLLKRWLADGLLIEPDHTD